MQKWPDTEKKSLPLSQMQRFVNRRCNAKFPLYFIFERQIVHDQSLKAEIIMPFSGRPVSVIRSCILGINLTLLHAGSIERVNELQNINGEKKNQKQNNQTNLTFPIGVSVFLTKMIHSC